MTVEDTFLAKGLRKKLVEALRKKIAVSDKVFSALETVPRHFFMDFALLEMAYLDEAKQISKSQTISRPSTVAVQTHLLDVQKYDKILEVGTGSGYQTAVLVQLGANVYSVERIKELFDKASATLKANRYFAKLFYGDGYAGLENFAPFDKIIVTCGASEIPQKLLQQLKIGGIMLVPVGKSSQKMLRITKISESENKIEDFGDFNFVPMLENKN